MSLGFFDAPQPVTFQLYCEELQEVSTGGHRAMESTSRPSIFARVLKPVSDPLPIWYEPFETADLGDRTVDEFPYHAITQRPMAMYHSWGSQNAWLRQIHTANRLFVPTNICDEKGLKDHDWAWVTSWHGRIKVQIMRMEAVNGQTLWTWNAIGKRGGAWALAPDAAGGQERVSPQSPDQRIAAPERGRASLVKFLIR